MIPQHALVPYDRRERTRAQIQEFLLDLHRRTAPERLRRIREAEEAEAERRRLAREVRELQDRYSDDRFVWREDAEQLAVYARVHRDALLARKQEIVTDYTRFHEDTGLIVLLQEKRPDLYARAEVVLLYRALALAERPEPRTEPPPAPDYEPRLRLLVQLYALPEFAWRATPEGVEKYAAHHAQELLAPKRRSAIVQAHLHFHLDDDFVALLTSRRPDIYQRTDEVFFARALACAERLMAHQKPPKPPKPPTPEEHRARKIRRKQVAFDDFLSELSFDFQALQALLQKKQELGIDEDEFDQLLRRFQIMQRSIAERSVRKEHAHEDDDEAETY